MSKTPKGPPDWYRLDNAGVLYSALQREKYSPVYRFSAVLSQPVDPAVLQRAVDRTMPRFPGFRVRMKPGVFWHYFEPNDSPAPLSVRTCPTPASPSASGRTTDGWSRFFYYQSRISLEVFHAVSDGAGALTFFRTLLAVYLRELGHPIPCGPGLLDVDDPPRPEELEDAYARYAGKRVLRDRWQETAFSNTSQAEPFYTLNVTMGFLPVDRLKEIAARYGASITEYLSAVLLQSILENQEVQRPRRPRPAALAIPIDLRGWFPSATLRNFILTVRLCVDPTLGPYTFPELVRYVHHYMRLHINPQEMRARFTRQCPLHRQPLSPADPHLPEEPGDVPLLPAGGGAPLLRHLHQSRPLPGPAGDGPSHPADGGRPGQATRPSPHCASISYGNTMAVTFAGTGTSSETERRFFTHLVREGIPVKVESNRTR